MFVQYIATQPILYLCERSVQRPEDWVSWRWWEQEVIGIEGAKERVTEDPDGEEEKCGEVVAQANHP